MKNARNYKKVATVSLCIVMGSDSKNISYSQYTRFINQNYAKRHGYDFQIYHQEVHDRAPQWTKLLILMHLLSQQLRYDYFFWIDDDAFFNHQDNSLESFIQKHPHKDLILCSDFQNSGRPRSINSGTMFVRNNDWCLNFFKKVWEKKEYLFDCCHEQSSMERVLDENPEWWDHLSVEPETAFNSFYAQIIDDSIRRNFVIHLMATPSFFRTTYLQNYLRENNDRQGTSPSPPVR